MTTYYATAAEVGNFLIKTPFTSSTTPTDTQVEAIINRMEDEIDRRTGHAWRTVTMTQETHKLPILYTYGFGSPIFLAHRNIKTIDYAQGDRVEIWDGSSYTDITSSTSQWTLINTRGEFYIKGYIFTVLRDNRIRLTYRYGDATVPGDIKEACILMTCIDLLSSSFKMDVLPSAQGIKPQDSMDRWEKRIDRIIRNREEMMLVTD